MEVFNGLNPARPCDVDYMYNYMKDIAVEVRKEEFDNRMTNLDYMKKCINDIPDDKLEAAYKGMSESLKQPVETVKKYYQKNAEQLEAFKHTLLQKESMDFISGDELVEVTPKNIRLRKRLLTQNLRARAKKASERGAQEE